MHLNGSPRVCRIEAARFIVRAAKLMLVFPPLRASVWPSVRGGDLIHQKTPDPRRLISYFYSVIHKQGAPSKTSKSLTFNPYRSPAVKREVEGAAAF